MTAINWFVMLASFILIAFVGWKNLPGIFFLTNSSGVIRYRFIDLPEGTKSAIKSNEIRDLVANLESLGFQLLGLKCEQLPLWAGTIQEVSLASRETSAFASIINVSDRLFYYFYTPFVSGAVVLTANSSFPEVQEEDFVQKVVYSCNPADMLRVHQQNVQQLKDRGLAPFEVYTDESRLEATRLYYASGVVQKISRLTGAVNLLIFLGAILLSGIMIWITWPNFSSG